MYKNTFFLSGSCGSLHRSTLHNKNVCFLHPNCNDTQRLKAEF